MAMAPETMPAEMPATETPSVDQGETAEIPASLVDAYPNVGDSITLTVIATNPDAGIITVGKGAAPEVAPEAAPGGSETMAAEFETPPA